MRLAILALLLTGIAHAESQDPPEAQGIPCWCIQGIARAETQSYWDDMGAFRYVDQRDGKDGEVSAFQITKDAFLQVAKRGERFSRLRTDQTYALGIACRYLHVLYRATGSWDRAVSCYNTGLHGDPGRGARYLMLVKLAAGIAP